MTTAMNPAGLLMMRFAVAIGFFVGLPNVAMAKDDRVFPDHPHEFSAGAVTSFFASNWDVTPTAWALDIGYHYRPTKRGIWQSLRFTEGFRVGAADDGKNVFDVYWRGELVAQMGPWTPTLGPELGLTTLGLHFWRINVPFPDDLTQLNEKKLSPFYAAFVATPLRFCFSRFTVSAFELSLGAPFNGIGTTARFQLGILHIGGTL